MGLISNFISRISVFDRKTSTNGRRAVITGIGVVSPIGIGLEEFWRSLLAGETGMDEISHFDASSFPCRTAAEVKGFDPEKYLTRRQSKYFSRATQFACTAYNMARDDARLQSIDPFRTDVVIGAAVCSFESVEKEIYGTTSRGQKYVEGDIDPLFLLKGFINAPACAIALMADTKGYTTTLSSACASSVNAVGTAAERIRDGKADMVITGGVDTPITSIILNAYCAADFLTTDNDNPKNSLCPFDKRRTKAALGEGAAMFIVEEREQAIARNARIYGEIVNFAQEQENVNEIFTMDKTGEKWAGTIRKALREHNIPINHINAHGPSDMYIDKTEAKAIELALGDKATEVPVSSIKGAVGSGMSSASAFQIAAAAMSLHTGNIPPDYNYEMSDPDFDLRIIRDSLYSSEVNGILVNHHGLGGTNSVMTLRRHRL